MKRISEFLVLLGIFLVTMTLLPGSTVAAPAGSEQSFGRTVVVQTVRPFEQPFARLAVEKPDFDRVFIREDFNPFFRPFAFDPFFFRPDPFFDEPFEEEFD